MASHRTDLCIVNMSGLKIVDSCVNETNNYDWDGVSRPDNNFQHVQVDNEDAYCQREEVNAYANSAWYTMKLNFSNGDWIKFRNDQYDARNENSRTYNCEGPAASYLTIYQTSGADVNAMYIRSKDVPDNSGWMTDLLAKKPDLKLNQITMLGSHDAGMYMTNECTTFVKSEWVITQKSNIYQQLIAGSRYFDFRVYYDGKDFRLGHFGGFGGAWGPLLSDVLNQISNFMKQKAGAKEAVIVKFSHSFDNHGGLNLKVPAIPANAHQMVVNQVKQVLGGYLYTTANQAVILAAAPLQELGGKVVASFGSEYKDYYDTNSGIIPYRDYPSNDSGLRVYDQYSNTASYDDMCNDQTNKLQQNGGANNNYLYLLSWTLTPAAGALNVECLASSANARLAQILTKIHNHTLKAANIVYIDFLDPYLGKVIIDSNND